MEKIQLAVSGTRPLKVLVPLIRQDVKALQKAERITDELRRSVGEKLIEAKSQVDRSEWRDWLRENFSLAYGTAMRWIRFSQSLPRQTFTDFRGARRSSRGLPDDIRKIMAGIRIDIDELSDDDVSDHKELGLARKLAGQLIDAGYRALSLKLHPDHGGTDEAMRRLIGVRKTLRAFASNGMEALHE